MTRAAWLAAWSLWATSACSRTSPIHTCDDSLRGVWRSEAGQPWMILDRGASLEAYPLFDDSRPAGTGGEVDPALVIAPRAIDLARGTDGLRGEIKRRYMRAADSCVATTPVRITTCANDQLALVLSDPVPPIAFTPCAWGRASASRVERWRRD